MLAKFHMHLDSKSFDRYKELLQVDGKFDTDIIVYFHNHSNAVEIHFGNEATFKSFRDILDDCKVHYRAVVI